MVYADFCGLNIRPMADSSYQHAVTKHNFGWEERRTVDDLAPASRCRTLPYMLLLPSAAMPGPGLLLSHGVHVQTVFLFACFTCPLPVE